MAEDLKSPSSSETSSDASPSTSTAPTSRSSSPPPCETILPSPLIPATLEFKDRQGPALPKGLPAIPWNDTPKVVDDNDTRTPDNWVKRHPELVRLTGKHPFNCEARLAPLFDAGFLTPSHLHVVRNHGAVPNVDEKKARDWRIRVHGLVEQEVSFSLEDLKTLFPVVTFPVTICCAGNRRREQNLFRKTLGFSWGSAGVSTALWTGVYLSDILDYVKPHRRVAKHVIFEGADDLPQGPYGTSQLLSKARNRENGMLIAWAMNGLPLEPDHGFPVRVVIPGQIGGRMVKWLTRIEVSSRESQHHLHFRDNKVLPTEVTPERARVEDHWWYDPRYIITELNVNSVIAKPDHNETLFIPSKSEEPDDEPVYNLRGFAYAGGGRRIGRVEISLDDGHTFELADIDYPEDLFRHVVHDDPIYGTIDLTERDTCFCWCFWTFPVPYSKLTKTSVISLRAMDEGMNTQPRNMYPNATGMLNNWWFRVVVHHTKTAAGVELRFEHPAPVETTGGWMERLKGEGKDILNPPFSGDTTSSSLATQILQPAEPAKPVCMTKVGVSRKITLEDLKAQDPQKPWFVVNGEVYDGTDYLKDHPGGADSILLVAGDDATEDFMNIHSLDAKQKLAEYHIGTLEASLPSAASSSDASPPADADLSSTPFLEPKTWKPITLTTIQRVNHDSVLYHFSFPHAEQPLGLPVGQHVFVRLKRKDTGEVVQRAYTPVSREDAKGGIEFLIKLYLPCTEFPAGGKMTVGFNQLEVGDKIELKGPLGSFVWKGKGTALWKGVPRQVKEIGLVCGGSGITPILQVVRSVLHDTDDTETKLYLLYANKTELDILCRDELESLLASHTSSDRLRIHYILSKVPENWTHSRGRVTDALLQAHFPQPGQDALVLTCGPEGMISQAVKPGLQRLGWDVETSLVVF